MNSRLYEIIRDAIMKNYGFSDEDVANKKVKWNSLLSNLNNFVDERLDEIRVKQLSSKKYQNPCISDDFINAINEADNKKFKLLRTRCLLTKANTLESLFCKPDISRKKDFEKKTKDFFAVCCGSNGWNDFTSKKHIDHTKIANDKNDTDDSNSEIVLTKKESITSKKGMVKRPFFMFVTLFLVAAIIFGTYWYTHPFIFNKFKKGEEGILIMSFRGIKDNSLAIDLKGGLVDALHDYPDISVKTTHLKCKGGSIGKQKAFAKEKGRKYNAKIVVWFDGDNIVYPRVTSVEPQRIAYKINSFLFKEFIYKEKELIPSELIKKPAILAKYIIGFKYESKGEFQTSFNIYNNLLAEEKILTSKNRIHLLELLCLSEFGLASKQKNLLNKDFYRKSKARVLKILESDPKNSFANSILGMLEIFQGKIPQAISHLRKVVENKTDSLLKMNTYVLLGDLYSPQVDLDISFYSMNGAEFKQNSVIAFDNNVYSNIDSALFYFNKAIEEDPENLIINDRIASLHYRNEDFQEAILVFNKIKKVDPKNLRVLALIGNSYLQSNKLDSALILFWEALEIDSINPSIWYNIALAYFYDDQLFNSRQCFNKVIKLTKDSSYIGGYLDSIQNRMMYLFWKKIQSGEYDFFDSLVVIEEVITDTGIQYVKTDILNDSVFVLDSTSFFHQNILKADSQE